MNSTGTLPQSDILSSKEIRRYIQQINCSELGITGQEKIKQSKVLVIGAGGKGSSVLQNLASAGVGLLGICDNYSVTEEALSRQHLYGNNDLGKQRAIIAKQKLMEINHWIEYRLHNVCLSENNIDKICLEYDVIIDTTDNCPSHFLISDAAVRNSKPHIFGSIDDSCGVASVFNYKGGPSLRSYYTNYPVENEEEKKQFPVFPIITINVLSSILANETIGVILGAETLLNGNLLSFDPVHYKIEISKIGGSAMKE